MKIAEIYSHLNGHEYLLVHRRALWDGIQAVVAGIDAHAMKTKVSKEVRMAGQMKYSPKALNQAFEKHLGAAGWHESGSLTG